MLTTSCSQEEDLDSQASDKKVQVVFTIALDGQSARSRATWGSEYDNNIGNDFDNQINPDQLFVKLTLTDANNTATTYDVRNIAYWQEGGINEYKFVGEVPVTLSSTATYTSAKIVVYANVDNVSEAFTTNYSTNPGTGVKYIPMWGVKTITSFSLTPGSMTDLGASNPICLLRSMAKVEVIMANNDYEISSIQLNRYNTTGNCLPTGATEATTTSALVLEQEGVFNPVTSLGQVNNTFAESTTSGGYKCYTLYVPEYDNLTTPTNASTITVTIDGKNYDIEFKNYSNGAATGSAYNIVRNHIYRFNITAVKSGLNLTLSVAPWNDLSIVHEYGKNLSYSTGSWSNYSAIDGNTIEMKAGSSATDNTTTAVYSFSVNTPKTIEWMAVLEDPAGKFQFDMSQTSGEGTVEGENAIQRTVKGELLVTGSNLNLGVKAITPNEKGQYEAILRVYVTYDNKTYELDLVDKTDSEIERFTILHSVL